MSHQDENLIMFDLCTCTSQNGQVLYIQQTLTIQYQNICRSHIGSYIVTFQQVTYTVVVLLLFFRILRRPTPVELARITISMGESPKQINFQRRNRSTWMSHSFPSASYLNQYAKLHQLSQSRVESIPAAGKPTASRPQSAHAYDGGVFSPTGPKNDYYVIHPEWVSEAMTIQKLNLKRRPNTLVMSASDTWPGRRCKSAPPQNRSNPITWDSSNQPDQV